MRNAKSSICKSANVNVVKKTVCVLKIIAKNFISKNIDKISDFNKLNKLSILSKKMSALIICLIFAFMLTGCATTKTMSANDKSTIKTVSVNKNVKYPQEMYYMAPGSAVGIMFGSVGALAVSAANSSPAKQFTKLARDNNIYIEQIVRDQLIKQINESKKFEVTDDAKQADADMFIDVKSYGFSIPTGFSSVVKPTMRVDAQLVKDSRIVWANSSYIFEIVGGDLPAYKPSVLKNNPVNIANAWNKAAEQAAKKIVQTM